MKTHEHGLHRVQAIEEMVSREDAGGAIRGRWLVRRACGGWSEIGFGSGVAFGLVTDDGIWSL